ncbi:MAG: late competence development ComFB family protein [Defluviitaleaceae bacterium]|nr:late competence development ComFB family protein [Defluviitaleaceae bacterium]
MSDIHLINHMETCVEDMIGVIMDSMNICKCEQCRMDIMAHALNRLPPKYVATRRGTMFTKLAAMHAQFDVDIITAISNAANLVGRQPRHEHDEHH